MATEIIDKEQYSEYDESLKLSLNKIFVKSGDEFYRLTDVYIRIIGKTPRKIKNWKDYKDNVDKLSVSQLNDVKPIRDKLFVKGYEIPQVRTEVDSSDGLTKYYKTNAETFRFDTSKYIMVHISNSKQPTFVKLSDIYFYNGLVQSAVTSETELTTKELYFNGNAITKIYTSNTFSFDNIKFKINESGVDKEIDAVEEIVDFDKKQKTVYSIVYDENNVPKIKSDGTFEYTTRVEQLKDVFVTQEYVKRTMPVENSDKTEEVSMVNFKQYKAAKKGEYILVVFENATKPILVKISDLKQFDGSALDASATDPTRPELNKYVGKSLKVNINGKEYSTKPLTLEQVTLQFSSTQFYQESLSPEDILSDEAKLKLKTGEFVSENEVAKQIYFKLLDNSVTSFDVYVANVTSSDGQSKQIIINKEYLEKAIRGKTSTFVLDGYTFDVSKIFKAKRVSNFSECDVVQTTSGVDESGNLNKIESCRIYTNKKERNADKIALDNQFAEDYKSGNYVLKTVYVDGVLTELDEKGKRYIYSENNYSVSYVDNKPEYKAMDVKPFYYESKDGELGKITGGPRYDVGKGISNSFKTWGKSVGIGAVTLLSPMGILTALAFPYVVAVAAAAAVISPIVIPVAHGFYGLAKNSINKNKWKNPEKFNETKWQKELAQELTRLKEETQKATTLSEKHFIAECHEIDRLLVALKQAHIHEGFELVDGKAEVTKHNAYAICRFMKDTELENAILKDKLSAGQLRELKRTLKKLTKKSNLTDSEKEKKLQVEQLIAKAKLCSRYFDLKKKKKLSATEQSELTHLAAEYDKLTIEFKGKMSHYNSEALVTEPDEMSVQLSKNAEIVKALLYLKHFAKDDFSVTLEDGTIIKIEDVKEALKEVDYDFEKNIFIYNRVIFSYDDIKSKNVLIDDMVDLSNTNDVVTKLKLIKQLIESKTINDIITQKPDETDITETKGKDNNLVEEEANLVSQIEQLNLELDELFKSTNEILDAIDPKDYEIINAFKIKVENLKIDCETALNYEEFTVSLDDLKAIIANLTDIKNDANLLKENSQKVSDYVKNVEEKAKSFEETKVQIEAKLQDKVVKAVLNDSEKEDLKRRLDLIIQAFNLIRNRSKVDNTFDDVEKDSNEINILNTNISELKDELEKMALENNKKIVLQHLENIITSTTAEVKKLDDNNFNNSFPEYCRNIKLILVLVLKTKEQIQKSETTVEDSRLLKRKAAIISKIIEVAVHSVFVANHVKTVGAAAEIQQKVNIAMSKVEECLKFDMSIDVMELTSKLSKVRSLYEKELVEFLTLRPKVTRQSSPRTQRVSSADLSTERALIDALKDNTSAIYNDVINFIMTKLSRYNTSEKAKELIEKFIETSENHLLAGESLTNSFKKGTNNREILICGINLIGPLLVP